MISFSKVSCAIPLLCDVAQQPAERYFCVACLKATFHRELETLLSPRLLRALAEEIGIAAEVRLRRERDGIDAILDDDVPGGGKRGNPMRK